MLSNLAFLSTVASLTDIFPQIKNFPSLCVCVCVHMSVHELYACVHLVCMNVLMHMEDRGIHSLLGTLSILSFVGAHVGPSF